MDNQSDPETTAIEALAQDYFLGMHEGDVERLRRIFHPPHMCPRPSMVVHSDAQTLQKVAVSGPQ